MLKVAGDLRRYSDTRFFRVVAQYG